jgi:hypothetical protein
LIGAGSEILSYDDTTSRDHHWGVRLQIFLSNSVFIEHSENLQKYLTEHLPLEFLGYSTHWSEPDAEDSNNQFPEQGIVGKINHRVEIFTLSNFLQHYLGIQSADISLKQWLALSEHQLLEVISGEIFHDGLNQLNAVRITLQYFPDQIWILKMISLWNEVSELFPLMGRTGSSGDNVGSQLICNKLGEIGMRLLFILNRKYAPYPKWFGRKFQEELDSDGAYVSLLEQVFYSPSWQDRQNALINFYIKIGHQFNDLHLIPPITFAKKKFFTRSHYILDCGNLLQELTALLSKNFGKFDYINGTVNELIWLSSPRDNPEFLNRFSDIYTIQE